MTGEGIAPGWTVAAAADLEQLTAPLSNWGRWGAEDERGTTNLLTPALAAAATAGVQSGEVVALGRRLTARPAADNPAPLLHLMRSSGEGAYPVGGSHASDWLGLSYHGFAVTHLDAPSHQFFDGRTYNGRPAAVVTTRSGAAASSVEVYAGGLAGRGVLLDVPAALGRPWLEPGTGLGPDDLDGVAAAHGVTVQPGDLVLVRTGRDARAVEHGAVDPMVAGSAGLVAQSLTWLRGYDVAVLGSDAVSDVMAPGGAPHPMPLHAGALVHLGLPLLDNLWLEDLAQACARHRRWTFLLTVAPLALARATGSPVNPLAVL